MHTKLSESFLASCCTIVSFGIQLDISMVRVDVFLGHRLGDGLVDWNSGVSVRTSVRTPTKSFSDFHLIPCVARP